MLQRNFAGLVTAKAGRQDLLPTGETGWQGPLEKDVAMGWVIAMKSAKPPGRAMEELLLQVVSRTLLPTMEGLEDLQKSGPAIPVPSWIMIERKDMCLGWRGHSWPPIFDGREGSLIEDRVAATGGSGSLGSAPMLIATRDI
jgi:hypothetical protein